MQFLSTISIVAALALSFAAAKPVEDLHVTKRVVKRATEADTNVHVYACTDDNYTGICAFLSLTAGVCSNVTGALQGSISSFSPDAGLVCQGWSDADCQGLSHTASKPGAATLPASIDNAIKSFVCNTVA